MAFTISILEDASRFGELELLLCEMEGSGFGHR